jgi:hypothetical protein
MNSDSVSILPKDCNYYAGGHVHIISRFNNEEYDDVIYPGPTFPNNFSELEKLGGGSFVFYDSSLEDPISIIKIPSKSVKLISLDLSGKSASDISEKLLDLVDDSFDDKIILLRLEGLLESGSFSDLDIDEFIRTCYDHGSFIVLRNSSKLRFRALDENTNFDGLDEDIESSTIEDSLGKVFFEGDEKKVIEDLISSLNISPLEGERKSVFLERVIDSAKEVLER